MQRWCAATLVLRRISLPRSTRDRMLVAQAGRLNAVIVSRDRAFAYDVPVMDA